MSRLVGTKIGDYRLTGFLGAGGMGEVYRAVQETLAREVAIKLLSVSQPELTQRFKGEARLHAKLKHPGIATLYDFVEFDGRPGIVMELVPGESIEERIRRLGPLPVSEAVYVLQQLSDAVSYLHESGIVHRDIKSGNVKVTPDGELKLLDFGIARGRDLPRMTEAGQFVGTLQYASPEQLDGEEPDARTDVWSMGVLFYETLTGQMPFEAVSVPELIGKIRASGYPPPSILQPQVPKEAEAVIRRCLSARASQRYADASELGEDAVALGRSVSMPRLSGSLPEAERPIRLRAAAPVGAAAIARLRAATGGLGSAIDWRWAVVPVVAALFVLGAIVGLGRGAGEPPAAAGITAALAPVSIHSPTGPAELWIDGERVGTTPWNAELPIGTRVEIVLRREGHQDRAERFEVRELDNAYSYPLHKTR